MTDANVSVSFSASIADFVSGVGEAKDALRSFSAPFGEIRGQLASLTSASSQAFSPERLQSYRDALTTTQSLEQNFAADSARAAAALRAGDDAAYADAMRAAQLATAEEVRIQSDGLKQKLALLSQEARFYEISQQERVAAAQRAIDAEYGAELAALQREDALGAQTLAAKQRTDDMIIEATRRRDDEMASLTRSALQQQEHDYQAFGDSITQAFNSQLRGLLSGTTNWHTAFIKVLDDLLIKFIEWCEKTVEHYVIAEAMKTAASTSGAATRTAAEEASSAAGIGGMIANALRAITVDAGQAFGGVFAFLAPVLGPAAAGPAAAAQGAVLGAAAFDIGAWSVPENMLSLVHRNELVMPAAEAGAFRSMLSSAASGGASGASVAIHPTTNVHVSALDAGSVSQWMKSNSSTMLRSIDEAVRHGAHLGLRRLGA
jgi:hypothetical protein